MLPTLQVLAILLVAIAMALTLAHALELPGKMRLAKDAYFATQAIYYPGFTIGGVCEPAALITILVLLILSPTGGAEFWLTLGAFIALLAMHATYWVLTHPVNNFWVQGVQLSRTGTGFFGFDPFGRTGDAGKPEWTTLRDRWEFSHVVRAILGVLGLCLIAIAVAA
jgi:hypothetical protein